MVKLEPLAAAEFAVKEVDLRKTDWWTLPRGSPGPSPSNGAARRYMHSDIDDDKARRALLEWEVLRDARHPLVLTAYDAALSPCGGKLRLILECAREDLNDLLTRVKGFRLPEHSARFIAAELVVALDHIHGRGSSRQQPAAPLCWCTLALSLRASPPKLPTRSSGRANPDARR